MLESLEKQVAELKRESVADKTTPHHTSVSSKTVIQESTPLQHSSPIRVGTGAQRTEQRERVVQELVSFRQSAVDDEEERLEKRL